MIHRPRASVAISADHASDSSCSPRADPGDTAVANREYAVGHVPDAAGLVHGGEVGADPHAVPGNVRRCRHFVTPSLQTYTRRMSLQSRYRFTAAWLPGGWRRNVVVSVDPAGDIVDVSPDDVVTTARLINGAAIPGMPNVHSHAFQRSMAGLAERARPAHGDSFWTWRETMYELASRMSPECLNAVAAQCYADMLKAGYTAVCEFHYLHNQPDGTAYAERGAMCQALIDAATTAGIGLTLLPTLYQTADFGGAPPTARQRQFVLATDQYLDLVDDAVAARSPRRSRSVSRCIACVLCRRMRCGPCSRRCRPARRFTSTSRSRSARSQRPSSICMRGRSSG